MNITEDYVSFEVATLLKEKGFEGDINAYYHIWDYGNKVCSAQEFSRSEAPHLYIPAPTHQKAMGWLREKGIECVVIPIWNTIGKLYRSYVLSDLGDSYKDNSDSYSENVYYEEAVEKSIKYALENLI